MMSANFDEPPPWAKAILADIADVKATIEHLRDSIPPKLNTVAETAEILGYSISTVRRMIRTGQLASVGVGKRLRVDLSRKPIKSMNAEDRRRLIKNL